jgi:hypothetical protein
MTAAGEDWHREYEEPSPPFTLPVFLDYWVLRPLLTTAPFRLAIRCLPH